MARTGSISTRQAVPVLVVSPDKQDHTCLHRILEPECKLHRATSRKQAKSAFERHQPSVVICEQVLNDGDWRDLLADVHRQTAETRFIVFSRLADDQLWIEVLNRGGYDLLAKPFAPAEVSRVVKLAANRRVMRSPAL